MFRAEMRGRLQDEEIGLHLRQPLHAGDGLDRHGPFEDRSGLLIDPFLDVRVRVCVLGLPLHRLTRVDQRGPEHLGGLPRIGKGGVDILRKKLHVRVR